jgi:hypothetical protein
MRLDSPFASLLAFALAVIPCLSVPQTWAERAAAPVEPAQEEPLPKPPSEEFLSKIAAPASSPVIKTKSGYIVQIDRSTQVLNVFTPKKEIWLTPELEANQTVEVTRDQAVFQQGRTVLARLKKGRLLFITKVEEDWAATKILDGGKVLDGWVRKRDVQSYAEVPPPAKSLSRLASGNFASAAVLLQKAKQFDDGLYAAVERAMQEGLGPVAGKRHWLARLAAAVNSEQGGVPLAQLCGAIELGGGQAAIPPALKSAVARQRAEFLADDKRAKPLGFYTWNHELEAIFRQDRLLQTPLETKPNTQGITALSAALAADEQLRRSYEQVLHLNERLTNPLKTAGYRALLGGGPLPVEPVSFFPPSRSPEADLVMRLYGDRPIPEGFSLMTEVIARLRSGELSFRPQADSGWYDHQLWSLEPLVRLDAVPEGRRLKPNDEYRKHLEELFKGTFALTRETHVKQLELPRPAAAAPPPQKEREKVFISPEPHVEILPTMYLRRAQSYAYVRSVLEETFGKENVAAMHRLTAAGRAEMNLADELNSMEGLFLGAYVVACRDLGLAEDAAAAGQRDAVAVHFLRWVASLRSDPDLARDVRMMVPVFYDQQRKKTKVWLMVGWTASGASYGYAEPPKVTVTGPDGKPAAGEEAPEINFSGSWRELATPVFAEVYVTRLLNREEFRRHCDTYATPAAIVGNLE